MARSVHVTCVASLLMLAQGQIYEFRQAEAPGPRSLHTVYAFYIYSHSEAPEKSDSQPFVEFQDFSATTIEEKSKSLDYQSLQVGLLPYTNFWQVINPSRFCSSLEDVRLNRAKQKDQLLLNGSNVTEAYRHMHTVRFPGSSLPKDSQARVRETGVFILTLSNCGNVPDITVNGNVIVKNAYGFLPGNEYRKMPFYGWLALAYVVLALLWMALSLRWWRELFALHYCIAAVIFLGLIEAFIWFVFYKDWNDSGLRSRILFILATLSSVVKSVFSYMLALVAALGWGVTRPYLDRSLLLKVQGLSVLYIILDFIRQTVLSFRHSHTITLTFLLLCLLPVALINGAIFYWIFTALANLMQTLKERKQIEKLRLFERLWLLIVVAITTASIALVFQIFDLSRSINIRWRYQWVFSDAVSHTIFLFVLTFMMYLWAPHMHSKRYAYSQAGEQDDEESKGATKPDGIWADEDLGDEEDDSLWSITHGKPAKEFKTTTAAPTAVGAAITEEEEDEEEDNTAETSAALE